MRGCCFLRASTTTYDGRLCFSRASVIPASLPNTVNGFLMSLKYLANRHPQAVVATLMVGAMLPLLGVGVSSASTPATSTVATPVIRSIVPGDGSLLVNFGMSSTTQAVSGYVVRALVGTRTLSTPCVSTTVQPTIYMTSFTGRCLFKGLVNGTRYKVQIRAKMAHGLSPYGTALATPAISKAASITLAYGWSKPGDTNRRANTELRIIRNFICRFNVQFAS